ncbi:TonB-dependent receptor [Congregibacter brevis]|uniref:TonB-dependent receptor n=1 Tax=Congregibacter brevis TaxID=3081201 RepID=A0ABZ0IGN2_9GAMM|nr:TonB-dependent receptor [Congregibacter sp. IMCC45268]
MNPHTPHRLAAAVLLVSAQMAIAQTEPQMEETVVVANSIKQSETAAILAKRDAFNVADVISADTIGRFPDQNLADSLARIPGIAIERDQGQARYVNLRGAPFRYTSIAFDGIDVPGAENGRIPRFDSFPAVITRELTVNKAITANMPGEAVSGFINIETHSPFDKEGLSLAGDIGLGEQDLGGGDVERLNLRGSFSNENFGILGFYSENSREQVTDNREFDFGLTEDGTLIPNEVDFRSYKIKRSDEAYGGTLEYRGEGALSRVYLTTLYSEFVDEEERNQYVFDFLAPQPGETAQGVPLSVTRALQSGSYENSTFTNTLGADFTVAGFEVQAAYNHTETEFLQDLPITFQTAGFAGLTADGPVPYFGDYDFSNQTDPLLFLSSPLAPGETADPANAVFLANLGIGVFNPLDQEVNKYKLDLQREVGNNSTLAFGLQFDQREAQGGSITQAVVGFPVDTVTINDFNTGALWNSNTTNTIGGTVFDNPALDAAWQASGAYPSKEVPPENEIRINEDILALYGMYTMQFDWGSAILGLRVEQTDVENIGVDGFVYEDDFTNWLPNAHLNFDLADNLKLRLSASTGVNRPTFNEWRATAALNPVDEEINGGNPTLEAEESYGFDSSLEYYTENGGILSAALFYRVVDNVIYADTTMVDAGLYDPALAGQQYNYIGFLNGSDGEFAGIELNAVYFLDELIDGLGVSANLTLADSEFTQENGEVVGLPGTSDRIWNAAVFYEKFGISVRINYSYRDDWISPIEDPQEFWGEMERLDAQISYTLPVNLAGSETMIYASFNNITDETDVRFAGNGTINQSESFGMHYLVGLRINL